MSARLCAKDFVGPVAAAFSVVASTLVEAGLTREATVANNPNDVEPSQNPHLSVGVGAETGAMSERLKFLLSLARQFPMTPGDRREQEIRLALENARFEIPSGIGRTVQ